MHRRHAISLGFFGHYHAKNGTNLPKYIFLTLQSYRGLRLQVPPRPSQGAGGGSAQVEVKFGAVVLCSGQCEYTRNLPLRAVSGSERLLVVAANMGMPLNHWAPCCDIPPAQRDPDA
jgi:hypothetical protein